MKWKKIIGWTLASVVALLLIAAVAGYVYLKSSGFQQFAIHKIVTQVEESTGGRAQISAFDFDLSTMTAHLYGVVVRGTEKPDSPPLLQIDKLTVGLKIKSVVRREISVSELLIEHPALRLQVDPNGRSNVPPTPVQNSSSNTSVFDMAVGHVGVSNGEINYNDRNTPVDADLHHLTTDIKFELLGTRYEGSISYDNGHLQYGEYSPLPHGLSASFTATPSVFKLDSALVTVASSTIKVDADVTGYTAPSAQGKYDVLVHAQDFAQLAASTEPAGDVALKGTFRYKNSGQQSFLKSFRVDGDVKSQALSALVSGGRLEARSIRGHYELADGSFRASGVEAETLGGNLKASLDVDHLDATPSSHLKASVRNLSLNAAQRALHQSELKQVTILGSLNATTDAVWTASISNVHARTDAVLHSSARKTDNAVRAVPIDGEIHAVYDGKSSTVALHQSNFKVPGTIVTAEGQISNHSRLEIQANSSDLHQLMDVVSAFYQMPRSAPLVGGSANLNATVQGSLRKPAITAHVTAQNLQVQGSEWKTAGLSLQADPSRLVVTNGALTNAHRGQASFDANIALRNWSYAPSSPIEAHVSLRQMQLADLQQLANVQYPVSGELSTKVSVTGSQDDPRGSGSLEIVNARAYDEPLKTLSLKFHGDKGSIVSELHLAADAGSVDANLTYAPKTKAYQLQLEAPAIVLQKLHTVQARNLAVQGSVTISAKGQGTVEDPEISASIRLPKLQVQEHALIGVRADLQMAHKVADLSVDSEIAQSTLRGRARVNLDGDYQAEASIDTSVLPLEVLLATFSNSAPQGFSGQTELHATLKGPLKDKSRLEAHLVIPTFTASYQSLQIAAASPIRADYANSVVTLQPSEIRGTGTSLRVHGSVPIGGNSAPTLTAAGTIDAHIFRILSPDLRSSGTIALDVRATGTSANPQVAGQVKLQDIAFVTEAAPLGIDKLNGTLDLENERVQVSNMSAQVGGGQVSLGGSMTYRPNAQFDLAIKADSVRLRYPTGLRYVLEGNLTWAGTLSASNMQGRVLLDSLSFTPEFDLASFGDQFSSNAATPAAPGFADTIGLNIAVQSKENLSATSSQISLEGSAALKVTGNAANPVITGRTDLTSGELFYRNVRYELQRGVITLSDPNETRPNLDVSVTTTVEQYNLTLNLRGPFDTLTTSYSSDPPLATADIINLIARGKTSSELAASSQSTDSMIASQAASQLSGGLQKLAGLSSLQIDPAFGGNGQNPSTRLAVQQRVTKNFLFTFSTDVSQPGEEIVQGDYQINKRWSVSVARDQLGGVTVAGRFHKKF